MLLRKLGATSHFSPGVGNVFLLDIEVLLSNFNPCDLAYASMDPENLRGFLSCQSSVNFDSGYT